MPGRRRPPTEGDNATLRRVRALIDAARQRLARNPQGNHTAILSDLLAAYDQIGGSNKRGASPPINQLNLLRQREERLADLGRRLLFHVQETPLGYIEWDSEARVVAWNRAAEEIFGYTAEEVQGRRIRDLIVPERLWPAIEAMRENLRSNLGSRREINPNRTRDGREIICEWHNTSLLDAAGNVIGWAALVQNITDQVVIRERLQSLNDELNRRVDELALIGEISRAVMAETRLDALAHTICRQLRQLLQARYSFIGLFSPDQGELALLLPLEEGAPPEAFPVADLPLARRMLAMPAPVYVGAPDFAAELPTLAGRLSAAGAASLLAAPLAIHGATIGVLAVAAEAADHFTAHDARLIELIAGQVAGAVEHTRLLEEARQARIAADSANRAKSRFLATMSHELRTPLTAVIGYAHMLRTQTALDDDQRHMISIIEQSGQHQLQLINDLLDLAAIEAGQQELVLAEVSLRPFLQSVADMAQVWAQRKGLLFQLMIVEEGPARLPQLVSVDGRRLRQALINLLGNAIKYTAAGAVALRVLPGPPAGRRVPVRFEVEDSGPGIAPDDLARIFEPFQRGGNGLTQAEGIGLGLAIVRDILRLMGSAPQVASMVGVGSRFWFDLELTDLSGRAAPQPDQAAAAVCPAEEPAPPA